MTEQTLWQKVENTQKHYARLLAMPNPSTLSNPFSGWKIEYVDLSAGIQFISQEHLDSMLRMANTLRIDRELLEGSFFGANLLERSPKLRAEMDKFLNDEESFGTKTFEADVYIPGSLSRTFRKQAYGRTKRDIPPVHVQPYGISHGKVSGLNPSVFARNMVKPDLFDKLGVDGVLKIPAGEHRTLKGIEHSGEDIYALLKSLSGSEEKSFHWGNPTQYENGERVTRSVSNVTQDGKVLYTAIDEIFGESPLVKGAWDSFSSQGVTQRMPMFARMPGRKTLLSLELHRLYGKKNPIVQFVKQNPHDVSNWSSEIDKFFNMRSSDLSQMDNRIVVTKSDLQMLKESIDADGYLTLENGNQVSVTRIEGTVTEFKIGGESYDNMIFPYAEKKGGVKAHAKRTKKKRHSGRKK